MRVVFVTVMIMLISVAVFGQEPDPLPIPAEPVISIDVTLDVQILTIANVALDPEGNILWDDCVWEPAEAIFHGIVALPLGTQIHQRFARRGRVTWWYLPIQQGAEECFKIEVADARTFLFWIRMRVRSDGEADEWLRSWWVLCLNIPGRPFRLIGGWNG